MSRYKETLKKLITDLQETEAGIEASVIMLNDGVRAQYLNESNVKEHKAFLHGYEIALKATRNELSDIVFEQGDDKEE